MPSLISLLLGAIWSWAICQLGSTASPLGNSYGKFQLIFFASFGFLHSTFSSYLTPTRDPFSRSVFQIRPSPGLHLSTTNLVSATNFRLFVYPSCFHGVIATDELHKDHARMMVWIMRHRTKRRKGANGSIFPIRESIHLNGIFLSPTRVYYKGVSPTRVYYKAVYATDFFTSPWYGALDSVLMRRYSTKESRVPLLRIYDLKRHLMVLRFGYKEMCDGWFFGGGKRLGWAVNEHEGL